MDKVILKCRPGLCILFKTLTTHLEHFQAVQHKFKIQHFFLKMNVLFPRSLNKKYTFFQPVSKIST